MSFVANTILKPISMATNDCLTPRPSLFTAAKISCSNHYASIPLIPIKSPYSLSVKTKEPLFRFSVTAANQEQINPVFLETREKEGQHLKEDFNWGRGASENDENGGNLVVLSEETKVYVGNLSYDVDTENLARLFAQAGVVETAEVICHMETKQSRGFGFVTMSTEEEADKAVELLNRHDVNGRPLIVNKSAPKGSRPKRAPRPFKLSYRIYAGNLPWSLDDSRLERIFSEHGKVVKAQVSSDRETGRSRGFGFVIMSSESEMNEAIANLDGKDLDGRVIKVSAAVERPRRNSF